MEERVLVVVNDYEGEGDPVHFMITPEQVNLLEAMQREEIIRYDMIQSERIVTP